MGSMETRLITFKHLDKFSHIGLFSGATISAEDAAKTEGFKEKVKLVFVSYGSKEVGSGAQPRRGGDPEATTKALKDAELIVITTSLRKLLTNGRHGDVL